MTTELWGKLAESTGIKRIGMPWSKEEDLDLLEHVSTGKNIKEIALYHERSEGGIRARLYHLAVKMVHDGSSYEEACKVTGIKLDELKNALLKKESKTLVNDKKRNNNINLESKIDLLTQELSTIKRMLKTVLKKLDEFEMVEVVEE
jgi:hypothetical protein